MTQGWWKKLPPTLKSRPWPGKRRGWRRQGEGGRLLIGRAPEVVFAWRAVVRCLRRIRSG